MGTPQPVTSVPLVDPDLRPALAWRLYLPVLDRIVRGLLGSNSFASPVALTAVATPTNANAAAAGVAVGQLYVQTGANPAVVYIRTA